MPYPERKEYSSCCKADVVEQKFSTFSFYQCAKCKEETDKYGNKLKKAEQPIEPTSTGFTPTIGKPYRDYFSDTNSFKPKWDGTFMVGDFVYLIGSTNHVVALSQNGIDCIRNYGLACFYRVIERNGIKFE